jgi:fermentation-respiration switch protein FrsA (DUF1100 family)
MFLTVLFWILGAATVWVLASPRMLEPIYDLALFEPHKFPRGDWSTDWAHDLNLQDVFIPTSSGKRLHGWFITQPEATATILVNHGNTGNIADIDLLVKLLALTGANVLAYDYRGYGKSDSAPSVGRVCEDGVAAFDWLAQRFPEKSIVIYGESLGGAVSTYTAQRRKPAGVILQSAFTDIRRIARETYPIFGIWPSVLFPRPYFDNAGGLRNMTCPVLIIHGEKDPEVVVDHANVLYAAAREPKYLLLLPNTEHTDIAGVDSHAFVSQVSKFVRSVTITITPPVVPAHSI